MKTETENKQKPIKQEPIIGSISEKNELAEKKEDNPKSFYDSLDIDTKRIFNKLYGIDMRKQLKELTKGETLADYIGNSSEEGKKAIEKLLEDQAAVLHQCGMSILGMIDGLDANNPVFNNVINGSTKLFRAFNNSVQTLNQMRGGGNQTITVKHQNVQVNGGQNIIADELHKHTANLGEGVNEKS